MKYVMCLVLLGLVVACTPGNTPAPTASPQPTAEQVSPTLPPPTPTPIPQKIKVIGYGYKIKDIGEGWSEGIVRLAFENVFDDYISGEKIDLSGTIVETQEGKTYPVSLYQIQSNGNESQTKEIDFSKITPVIPPHFRWTRLGVSGDTIKYNSKAGPYDLGIGEYYLRFRPATAAHPTRIVFPKRPEWKIDLNTATQTTLALPADTVYLTPKPISALAGKVLIDSPTGLKVTLDGAGIFATGAQDVQLKYTIVNKDKLDSHSANVELPIRAFFFSDGAVKIGSSDIITRSILAGPGQTKQVTWSLGNLFFDKKCNSKVYALIQDVEDYELYNLNVCK